MTEQEKQAVEKAASRHLWNDAFDIRTGFKAGAEFALSELRKPSENLVEEIVSSLELESHYHDDWDMVQYLCSTDFEKIAQSIANLAPFNQNAKLLEALRKIVNLNAGGEITGNKSWVVAQEALKEFDKWKTY